MSAVDGLFRLDGRNALVTGAAGYLGAAMAEALADAGARVILAGRTAVTLETLAERLRARGASATSLPLDLAQPGEIDAALARIARDFDGLAVLVNNAYEGPAGTFATATDQDYEQAYRLTVVAAAHLIRGATGMLEAARARAA